MRPAGIAPVAAAAALAFCSPSSSVAAAFAPSHPTATSFGAARTRTATTILLREANVLDGRDIDGEFTPINNMLLVKKAGIVDTTEGGIILTGKQKITKSEGLVVSAGPGRTNLETGYQSPMPVAAGEKVMFGKYDGTEVTYNGEKHTLIRDDDVLVKFPPSDDDDSSDLNSAEVLWDSVLVRVPKIEEEKSSSGILFAKTSTKKKKSSVGEVVKVGPGRYAFNGELMEMDVEPGDRIKFRDFAAQEVEIEGEEFAVVRMTDILAKF